MPEIFYDSQIATFEGNPRHRNLAATSSIVLMATLVIGASATPAFARPTLVREIAKECDTASSNDSISACEEFIATRRPKGNLLSMVYNNIGIAYSRMGDHERAVEAFSNALRADSRHVPPRTNRARSLASIARFDDAIADMDAAIKLAPTGDHYALRADFRERNSDLDGALADLAEAIKRQPAVAAHYSNRATVYAKLSKHAESIEDFSRAIQLNPRDPSLYFGRGLAWANAGKCDQAVPDYTKAITLSPRYSTAYNNRGVCNARAGKRDEAIADYEEALKWAPGNELARRNLEIVKNTPIARPIPAIIEVPKFDIPKVEEMLKVPEFPIEATPAIQAVPIVPSEKE